LISRTCTKIGFDYFDTAHVCDIHPSSCFQDIVVVDAPQSKIRSTTDGSNTRQVEFTSQQKTVMHRESQQHPNNESTMMTLAADGGDMKLGIDEFMGDDVGQAEEIETRTEPVKNKIKANKGKRRPKYKNLVD
jgi:hypothetical protein